MRKSTIFKTIWNSLATNGLLTHASNHLGDIDEGTFGARYGHDECCIGLVKLHDTGLASLITDGAEFF